MAHVKIFCFLASYTVALGLEVTRLFGRSAVNRLLMLVFAFSGFVAHTSYLWFRGRSLDIPPLLSSTQDWFLVLAWIAVLVYVFVTLLDRTSALGIFLLPLVLILLGAAYFVSSETNILNPNDDPQRIALHNWAMLHATLMVFGVAGVIFSVVWSLMYLVRPYRLKHTRTLRDGFVLPSLARLARWNRWAVILSVPLLTLGLASGFLLGILSRRADVPVTFHDPFILITVATWFVMFVFFLWLLRGRHPAGGGAGAKRPGCLYAQLLSPFLSFSASRWNRTYLVIKNFRKSERRRRRRAGRYI